MNYSSEQKKILKIIYNLTQRDNQDPRGIWFEKVIEELSPENYFVHFKKEIDGVNVYSTNPDVQEHKKVDSILGNVISYLFLLDKLVEENMIIVYQSLEKTNINDIHIKDCKGNSINDSKYTGKDMHHSRSWSSETFWNLIITYGNTVILPSFSLIDFIRNDFQTAEELHRKNDLKLSIKNLNTAKNSLLSARKSLRFTKIALVISIVALLISSFAEFWNVNLTKKEICLSKENNLINKENLTFTKSSATDSSLNLIINEIKQLPIIDIQMIISNIDLTLKDKIIKTMQDENMKTKNVRIIKEAEKNIKN